MDDEFENVSGQLLKRTQAMLDKYRHLLFEESRVCADLLTLLTSAITARVNDSVSVLLALF